MTLPTIPTSESAQLLLRMIHYNASRLFHAPTKNDIIIQLMELFQLKASDAIATLEAQLQRSHTSQSKVLQTLIDIFTQDTTFTTETSLHDLVTKLVRVMLSSPSHILPLMHFILPLKWQNLECFSECWVALDPHNHAQPTHSIHVLLSIQMLNHTMEIEIKGSEHRLNITTYGNQFTQPWLQALEKPLRKHFSTSVYTLESYGVVTRDKLRSIAEVFVEFESTFKGINAYV